MIQILNILSFISLFLIEKISSVSYSSFSEPICNGQQDSGPGGMFGYSTAISTASIDGNTYMAIGKPWDSSVHLYYAPSLNLNISWNATTGNPLPKDFQWLPMGIVKDTNNGTYPDKAQSLFGYSVSMTDDGVWLAVGIPGRTYQQIRQQQIQFHDYAGAVRIYKQSNATNTTKYLFVGEIPNPNGNVRFWDKFGSKVSFKSEVTQGTFLFVSANSGWDGATTNFYSARPYQNNIDSGAYPVQPTNDVSRAGVYVYKMINPQFDPATEELSGSIVNPFNGIFSFLQFIKLKSSVPLGMTGIDFDVLIRSDPSQAATVPAMSLFMRDFIIPSSQLPDNFLEFCPYNNCSYIQFTTPEGNLESINATNVVVQYDLQDATGTFTQSQNIFSSSEFDSSVDDWDKNDWFGLGLTYGYDSKYNRYLVQMGAPKSPSRTFSYYTKGSTDQWQLGQVINNFAKTVTQRHQSSFGQTAQYSPNGRFLVISNPAGTQQSYGRGQVYVLYRQAADEILYPYELNNITLSQLSNNSQVPYFYDRLVTLSKRKFSGKSPVGDINDDSSSQFNFTQYEADHFGLSLAISNQILIVGSPVEQCVYTYFMPQSIDVPKVPPPPPANQTAQIPTPTSTPNSQPQNQQTQSANVWIYALIAGIVALLIIIPVVMYIMKRKHKQKILKELQERNEKLNSNFNSEDALMGKGMGGTQESLDKVKSSETLNG